MSVCLTLLSDKARSWVEQAALDPTAAFVPQGGDRAAAPWEPRIEVR